MKIFFSLAGLIVTLTLSAQSLNFSHFTLEHNLPVDFLMQDSKGYLWMSSKGVFRFDGLTTKRFVHNIKNANSLIDNNVHNIVEDKEGTIWIATQSGISHYFPIKDSFENFTSVNVDAKHNNSATDNFIFCDSDNNIWIGNQTGIYLFNRKDKSFHHYPLQNFQKPGRNRGTFITSIIQDKLNHDFLWLSSYDGIAHFNKTNGQAKYFYFDSSKTLTTKIFEDSHNNIWVCTWGEGVGTFNPATGLFSLHSFQKDTHYGITNVVTDINEQVINKDSSIFYLCTSKGLGTFTTGLQKHQPFFFDNFYSNNPTDKSTIGLEPKSVLIDRQGVVWIGTSIDLSYILHNNQVFKNYTGNIGNVYSIIEEKNKSSLPGYAIASWYMDGLYNYDYSFTKQSRYPAPRSYEKTNNSKQINAILQDTINHITWIATLDGLYKWNTTINTLKVLNNIKGDNTSLPSGRVIAVIKDGYNRLWLALYAKGIAVINSQNDKIITLPKALNNLLSEPTTPTLFSDNNKNTWIGLGEKLVFINSADLSFKIYNTNGGEIHCITQDKSGNIWVGCSLGLRMLNDKKTFDVYTMSDGLPNDNISCLCNGYHNNLWICTEDGISNFNIAAKTFTNYFTDDGLAENSEYNCITTNSKGEIIIGGNNFITVFNPALLTINTTPPPVYITSIRLLNRDGSDTVLNYPTDTLKLSYNQNYFNVSFTALNLINAGANRYAYILEGLDNNWINTYTRNAANYSNLSPGTYTFRIKAANNNGVWNIKGASLTIIISPPYWRTWWFITLCAILLCATVFFIYQYRLNQALKLERLRTRISTDLHDDIGSTLSSISILSDMVIHGGEENNSNEMLHEIKENSVSLMEKMDDIVWSINPRNDSLENLLLRIKRFAAQLFEAKNIDYEINISEDLHSFKIPMEIRQHLYLMIKEAINNIIKHSQCNHAVIKIEQFNEFLKINITDNGKGFNTQEASHGNGIINLNERAKLINASLAITSNQPLKGTQIKIELKIK